MSNEALAQQFATRRTVAQYEAQVERLQRQLRRLMFARWGLGVVAAWGLLWGTLILPLRMVWGVPVVTLLWGAVGGIPALVGAWVWSRRDVPSDAVLRAWLDRQSRCGGLFMASGEQEMGGWARYLPATSTPTLRWKSGRSWLMVLASGVYVGGSLLVPQQSFQPVGSHRLDVGREVAQLRRQIEALREEKVLTPKRAKALEKKLKALQKEARGTDPAKTLQAMDHLSRKLQNVAKKAAERALAQTEKWLRAKRHAEALSKWGKAMKPTRLSKEMKKLAKQMRSLLKKHPGLAKKMPASLRKSIKMSHLKMRHLKAIKGVCKGGAKGTKGRLARLSKARLISAKALKKHASMMAKSGKKAVSMMGGAGVSRGGGPTPMTWKTPSSSKGAAFKPQVLPPSKLADLKQSQQIGTSMGAPEKREQPGQGSTGGGLQQTTSGQSAAHTQRVYPQHLGTVRRYFQRSKTK